MSLRYLPYSALNLTAWDACVATAQPALPYAYSWWLRTVAGRWDAVVELGPQGEYWSVLPLPYKRRPWGKELFQPAFTQQLGLLTTLASCCHDIAAYWMLITASYARGYQQLNVDNSPTPDFPDWATNQRQTYQLALAPNYATLLSSYAADYRRRLRQNCKRAIPLTVTTTHDPTAILRLFQATKGTAAGLTGKHYAQLRRLIATAYTHGSGLLREVRDPVTDELLAGAWFVRERSRLIYLFAAASPAGKRLDAPLLILNEIIEQYAGTPELILDFEGSMIPSIARFFANFGAQPVPYATFYLTQRPWYLQWMR